MADLDLRPLSLGEILDRTFTLYRRNFLLFLGINALPHLLILAMHMVQTFYVSVPATVRQPGPVTLQNGPSAGFMAFGFVGFILGFIIYMIVYLFSQGGTVFAVSDLYLGRSTTIGASFNRMRGQLGSLFGVLLLNGLVVMVGTIFLIIPGIYLACRLITCVPAALLEDLGPRSSLERSFALTKDSAGRAFVIYLLYFILIYAAMFLLMFPFAFVGAMAAKDPSMLRLWMSITHVGEFVATVLVSPFLTIATAVFYYDLRVRKEAFDLQLMMNPGGALPAGAAGVPHTLA
jgi:hypothetical protein